MNVIEFDISVSADHPSLPGHFPQQPIVPGVLLLDQILTNLECATGRRSVRLRQVKFISAMRPREQAHIRCEVDGQSASFRVNVQRLGTSISVAVGVLTLALDDGPSP